MKDKIIKLKNGGTLIYGKTRLLGSSAFEVGFKVGAFCEKKPGTAHMLEHTLFKKTKNRTNKQVEEDRNKIAYINASTSMDYLVLKFVRTSKLALDALGFASDILINSVVDDEFLSSEKGVIKEELMMRLDGEQRDIYVKNFSQALNRGLVASDIVGKTPENIDKITFKDLQKYKSQHFVGNNFVCSVVSSLPLPKIKRMVNKYFVEKIPFDPSYVAPKSYYETNDITRPSSLKIFQNKQEKITALISFKFNANEWEIFSQNLNYKFISQVALGAQGNLFLKLRNKGLIYRYFSDIASFKNNSLLCIVFECAKEKIKEIVELIASEVKTLVESGVDHEEIETYKKNLSYLDDEEMPRSITSRCRMNLSDYLSFGKILDPSKKERKKLIDGINVDAANDILKEIFSKDNSMYVTFLGEVQKKFVPTLSEFKKKFLIVG